MTKWKVKKYPSQKKIDGIIFELGLDSFINKKTAQKSAETIRNGGGGNARVIHDKGYTNYAVYYHRS